MLEPATILALDVQGLAAAIRSGRTTSAEVLEAYKARLREVDNACNAVTAFVEEADTWAKEADEHLARTGQPLGPLHGVPCI